MPSRNARAPWWTVMVWATCRKPDQLEPVQSLGTGLIAVHLRESCVNRRVGRDDSVYVREPEEAAYVVHHRGDRGSHQAGVAELSDVQLDVSSLNPQQGVEAVGFAPCEPSP